MLGIHIDIDHITASERKAFDAARHITDQIKALLESKEIVTLEKLTGTEQLGADGKALLQQFIDALNSPAVTNTVALVNTFLGGLGANLQGLIHEGCVILHGISEWVHKFELLYQHAKKA